MKKHRGFCTALWIVAIFYSILFFICEISGDSPKGSAILLTLIPAGIAFVITAAIGVSDEPPAKESCAPTWTKEKKNDLFFVAGHYLGQLISRLLR